MPVQLPRSEFIAQRPPLGLLGSIGYGLNYPSMKIRELLTGLPEATGRDLLEKFGILQPGQGGLGAEAAGFGAEVLTDPLTYVGGIGQLTKLGEAASRAGKLEEAAKSLALFREAQELGTPLRSELGGKLADTIRAMTEARTAAQGATLPASLGEQVSQGLRAPLQVGLPFVGRTTPFPALQAKLGAPVFAGLEKAGAALKNAPGVPWLRQAFSTDVITPPKGLGAPFEKSPIAAPYFQEHANLLRRAPLEGGETYGDISKAVEAVQKASGPPGLQLTPEEVGRGVLKGREVIPGGFGQKTTPIIARWLQEQGKMAQGPEFLDLISKLRVGSEKQYASEVFHGTRDAGSYVDYYAERVLSPEAKRYISEHPDEWAAFKRNAARKYTTGQPSQIHRELAYRDMSTAAMNDFFQSKKGLKGYWFEEDPAKSFVQRQVSSDIANANADLFNVLGKRFGTVPHVEGQTMPLSEFYAHGPLHSIDLPHGQKLALFSAPKDIEGQLAQAGMGGRGIPLDIAKQALEVYRKVNAPEEISQLFKRWDQVTRLWQYSVTVPFPGFHVRNLLSDTALNFIGGAANPALIPEALAKSRDPAFLRELEIEGARRGSKAGEIMREYAPPAFQGGDIVGRIPGVTGVAKAGAKVTTAVEDFTRTWHYLSRLEQGATKAEAAASVRRWLFDYGDLTDTEKKVFKRIFFFYNWPRKVIPLMLKAYIEEPAKMAALTRLTTMPSNQRGQTVPEFVRQSVGIPLGPGPEGQDRYLTGLGSPLEELQKLDFTSPEGGFAGGLQKLGRSVVSNLNPLLKLGVEYPTGRETYFDRPISEGDYAPAAANLPILKQLLGTTTETLRGGGTRTRASPELLYLLRNSPLGRFGRTAGQLANVVSGGALDKRSSGWQDFLQFLTGVKVANLDKVDQLRAQLEEKRRQAGGMVSTGELGISPTIYARKQEGEKSPRALQLMKDQARILEELKRAVRK